MPDFPFPIPAGCPQPPTWPPPPDWWQLIVVALSNGKDSRAVLHDALTQYPRQRILCLYNFMGNEHAGSLGEAKTLCEAVDVPLLFTWKRRKSGHLVSEFGREVPLDVAHTDLVLELAWQRGRFADRANPLCTSTGKRDPSDVALRSDLVVDIAVQRGMWPDNRYPLCTNRGKEQPTDTLLRNCVELPDALPVVEAKRILLLSGERAEESPRRAHKETWDIRAGATSPQKGRLALWHRPVHGWTETQVWAYLEEQHSPAMPGCYSEGFSRHSCVHCFHKSWVEQCLAFVIDPRPAAVRVAVEEQIGHRVKLDYFYCGCGCASVRQVKGTLVCGDCGKAASEGCQGYRAVWEFVYGPWRGAPERSPEPRGEAIAMLDRLRRVRRQEYELCE